MAFYQSNQWVDKGILLAQESSSPYTPFNRQNNPSAFDAVKGTDADEVEVGKDPEEVFEQLELPLDLAAHDKQDDTAPDGYDPLTGLEWKIGPDGKPHFVYPDDEPPPAGIDLDKAEADLFQRIQLAHAIPGEHGHPGGMGFEQKVVPQRQDLIYNPSDNTKEVKFPTPVRGGGYTKKHPMMAPQTTPNTPHPGELAQSIDGINTILLPLTPKDPTAVDDESYGEPPPGLTDDEERYLLEQGWSGLPSGGWKIPNKRNTGMG